MSRNPLRRISRALLLAAMRLPLAQQLAMHRPARDAVDLAGKRVLVTGASSGIGASGAEQFGGIDILVNNAGRSIGRPLL